MFRFDSIFLNWEVSMGCGLAKKMLRLQWYFPSFGSLKFNVDGASRGKPRSAAIGSIFRNCKGEILFVSLKYVGIKDSNEAEVLAILEALRIFSRSFRGLSIVESDSSNVISWVKDLLDKGPWRFHFYFKEIKSLASSHDSCGFSACGSFSKRLRRRFSQARSV